MCRCNLLIPVLYDAVYDGDLGKVERLLKAGIRPEEYNGNMMPLHLAIKNGREDITELLLMYGASVTKPDIFGASPAHHAVLKGSLPIMKLLIKYCDQDSFAEVLTCKYGGKTVKKLAEVKEKHDIADFLTSARPPSVRGKSGNAII